MNKTTQVELRSALRAWVSTLDDPTTQLCTARLTHILQQAGTPSSLLTAGHWQLTWIDHPPSAQRGCLRWMIAQVDHDSLRTFARIVWGAATPETTTTDPSILPLEGNLLRLDDNRWTKPTDPA